MKVLRQTNKYTQTAKHLLLQKFLVQGVSKKTEFYQIKHLQILLVVGRDFLVIFRDKSSWSSQVWSSGIDSSLNYVEKPYVFVLPLVLKCFFPNPVCPEGCICKAPNKSIEIADSKHDTTGFATNFIKYFSPNTSRICKCSIWQNSVFLDTLYHHSRIKH